MKHHYTRFTGQVILLLSSLLLLVPNISMAGSAETRQSFSLGQIANADTPVSKETVLATEPFAGTISPADTTQRYISASDLSIPRTYTGETSLQVSALGTLTTRTFSIYDTSVNLIDDYDGDGYYHYFDLTFDADISEGAADVYALVYLSYEGGPWLHFYTSDIFTIAGNSSADAYTVTTHLDTNYPTGSYDVLIELFEVDWTGVAAFYGPTEGYAMNALPLEDANRDTHIGYGYSVSGGGGCSLSPASKFDPTFYLMGLISLLYLYRKNMKMNITKQ